MTHSNESADTFLDRNLTAIGSVLSLPARADGARRTRWQQDPASRPDATAAPRRPGARRKTLIALFATTGLAAAVALFVFRSPGSGPVVSAQTIMEQFRQALRGSLSIELAGIDLVTSLVSGEILLDRRGPVEDSQKDSLYSELHVLLKADNREWNDLDGVVVVCQAPGASWLYCRGNGGMGLGGKRVIASDFFVEGDKWQEFEHDPLGSFGSLPDRLSFGSGDSGVVYFFPEQQRAFVRRLLGLLLDLSDPQKADAIVAELKGLGNADLQKQPDGTWRMQITDCGRLTALQSPLQPVPVDTSELTKDITWELTYEPDVKKIGGWSTSGKNTRMIELGMSFDFAAIAKLDLPTESREALVAHFEKMGLPVETEKALLPFPTGSWKIRVKGFPLPLESRERDWAMQVLPGLLAKLTLSVYYDATAHRVTRAEFSNVAGSEGRITLNLGEVHLDPARLDSSRWTKGKKPSADN